MEPETKRREEERKRRGREGYGWREQRGKYSKKEKKERNRETVSEMVSW